MNYFKEWELLIEELDKKELELIQIKNEYLKQSETIIDNTNFKELYGRNNESIRKLHIQTELKELCEKKIKLESEIKHALRKIDYLKNITAYITMCGEYK